MGKVRGPEKPIDEGNSGHGNRDIRLRVLCFSERATTVSDPGIDAVLYDWGRRGVIPPVLS